ncbi:MAG: HAMP domain-containing histidine kinase [Thaumarchaeota archaeon]|nr:HAMP domain-containing histidine kinase [Nitrososphaerota archaeon]
MSEINTAIRVVEGQKIKYVGDAGLLSSRIAHDLKNPLSVIKNSVELMRMRTNNMDSRAKNDFDRIERATVRISHQIEEVLEYIWPRPLNLSETSLLHILKLVKSRSNVQQVVFEVPEKDVKILCDATKMEIVFSNLILNAVQAMDGIGYIRVRAREENDCVTVEVEDTGHGIPAELLPKIFEPMFTTRQIGTCLGLVSCKTIVEKHGGSISVNTGINKGTTFTIKLPKAIPKKA